MVLIDELDVHLHPKWQRRVVEDLKSTFPKVQFIATSHSPFVIQTLDADQLVMLDDKLPLAEFGNKPIGEIAAMMGVERPEVSPKYRNMVAVAKDYLQTLDEASIAPAEKLAQYVDRLAFATDRFAEDPAFQAYLEVMKEAKIGAQLREVAENLAPPTRCVP